MECKQCGGELKSVEDSDEGLIYECLDCGCLMLWGRGRGNRLLKILYEGILPVDCVIGG
jgi:hypothetical protein